MKKTTISVTEETKKGLDNFKIIPREQYNEVIKRLLKGNQKCK